MGHWSESLVDKAAEQVGGTPDRRVLMDLLAQAGRELEVLSGRTFRPLRRTTSIFEPNGLPFVDLPDAHAGSLEAAAGVWEVPDPVNNEMATVLQLSPVDARSRKLPLLQTACGSLASSLRMQRKQGRCQPTTCFSGWARS